jgi:hypothetical protein
VPYRAGTYLLRAVDSVGQLSDCIDGAQVISTFVSNTTNLYGKICDSPNFIGTHNGTVVKMPQDWLTLDTATPGAGDFIDDWAVVDAHDLWDDVIVAAAPAGGPHTGEYIFNSMTVLPKAYNVKLSVDMDAHPYLDNAGTFIDARIGFADDWAMWDDSNTGSGTVQLYVSRTTDDPSSPTATWGPWEPFQTGDWFGRGFKYKAVLSAPDGENIGIETLCVLTDLVRKTDNAQNVSYAGGKQHITFTSEFIKPPSVAITLENGVTGDYWTITGKDEHGFDIEFFTAAGADATGRQFDWIATGY